MQKRKLGSSSLEVAPLTLGGNVFGWTIDEKNRLKYWMHLLQQASILLTQPIHIRVG
jgi:aryl-alcohol dehydrogenase-like predicted oxidoreductase